MGDQADQLYPSPPKNTYIYTQLSHTHTRYQVTIHDQYIASSQHENSCMSILACLWVSSSPSGHLNNLTTITLQCINTPFASNQSIDVCMYVRTYVVCVRAFMVTARLIPSCMSGRHVVSVNASLSSAHHRDRSLAGQIREIRTTHEDDRPTV